MGGGSLCFIKDSSYKLRVGSLGDKLPRVGQNVHRRVMDVDVLFEKSGHLHPLIRRRTSCPALRSLCPIEPSLYEKVESLLSTSTQFGSTWLVVLIA